MEEEADPNAAPAVPAVPAVPPAPNSDDDSEDNGKNEDQDDEADEDPQGIPLDAMNRKQLRGIFGRDALAMLGAMFQHTSKICDQALHQPKEQSMVITKPNGKKALYRKGQIHPTAVYSALQNALACTASSLGPAECFIQMGGGTPEGIVAAMMVGFNRILYVASSDQELNGMRCQPSMKSNSTTSTTTSSRRQTLRTQSVALWQRMPFNC